MWSRVAPSAGDIPNCCPSEAGDDTGGDLAVHTRPKEVSSVCVWAKEYGRGWDHHGNSRPYDDSINPRWTTMAGDGLSKSTRDGSVAPDPSECTSGNGSVASWVSLGLDKRFTMPVLQDEHLRLGKSAQKVDTVASASADHFLCCE